MRLPLSWQMLEMSFFHPGQGLSTDLSVLRDHHKDSFPSPSPHCQMHILILTSPSQSTQLHRVDKAVCRAIHAGLLKILHIWSSDLAGSMGQSNHRAYLGFMGSSDTAVMKTL